VELAGQADFVDPLDSDPFHGMKRRLAVEAQEAGSRVEDAVAVPRERDEELLRALEAEPPLDDREAEDVEPARGSNGGAGRTGGGLVAQKPYLATNARILRDRESTDPPPGSRWPVRLLASRRSRTCASRPPRPRAARCPACRGRARSEPRAGTVCRRP